MSMPVWSVCIVLLTFDHALTRPSRPVSSFRRPVASPSDRFPPFSRRKRRFLSCALFVCTIDVIRFQQSGDSAMSATLVLPTSNRLTFKWDPVFLATRTAPFMSACPCIEYFSHFIPLLPGFIDHSASITSLLNRIQI